MQNIFHISQHWHDPVPGLRRVITLILAILFVESFACLLNDNSLLGILRAVDILILLFWGPWFYKGAEFSRVVRDALKVTIFFVLAGILFLIGWKLIFGSSMLRLTYEKGFLNHKIMIIIFFTTRCLLSPVAEELFFRGIIYRKIRENLSAWISITAVSLLFAFIHFYFSGQTLSQSFMPFLGSLVFCLGYEKTKFILTPILLHISGNFIIFLSPFISLI
ncbi:MAG: CPBP family intramembrane metalloprotease [Deltaproteobacteria bacterium]|nr:CPBP family intramembrane metalloprotease [Deltaproteobacteria bacterium]